MVDSGNLLFKKALSDGNITIPLKKAHGLIKSYRAMAYDAVAVSPSDLTAGQDFFKKSSEISFPWVSANVVYKSGELVFAPHISKKIGDLTVGIIGLTGGRHNNLADFTINDWHKALRTQIDILKDSCDMLMVLSNLSSAENRKIAKNFHEINLVITANKGQGNVQPHVLHNCLISQGERQGKYIAELRIGWHPTGRWFVNLLSPLDQLKHELGPINWGISHLQKNQSGDDPTLEQEIAVLQSNKTKILKQISTEKANLEKNKGLIFSTFESTFWPVKPSSTPAYIERIVKDVESDIRK